MKLEARKRLQSGNNSATQFLDYLGRLCSGQIKSVSSKNDCRVTVANYLLSHQIDDKDEIIVVGLEADIGPHAVHVFLADTSGRVLADSFGGSWDPRSGFYMCTIGGEQESLVPLIVIPVSEFRAKYVTPLLHGHVVPRPDGVRAKCGGPGSKVLHCAICAREEQLLASGHHPLTPRFPFESMPYKLVGLKFGFRSEEMMQAFLNFLGAAAWEGTAGHSTTVGLYVDGDGADQMRIEGIAEKKLKIGGQMARAACDQGDSIMVEVSNATAAAFNGGPDNKYTRTVVYPELEPGIESKSDELQRLANEE